MKLGGRVFEIVLDLFERELVVRALVPIGFVVDGMEHKAETFGGLLPVMTLCAEDFLHGYVPLAARTARTLARSTPATACAGLAAEAAADRKSTRLNSSH